MTNILLFDYNLFLEEKYNSKESKKQINIEKTQLNNSINENDLCNNFVLAKDFSKNKQVKLKFILNDFNSTNNKTENKFLNNKRNRSENNKKKGRISKKEKEKGATGKHTKNEYDNMKRKVVTDCVTQLHTYIKNSIKEVFKIKLYKPTITPQMKTKNDNDVKELSKKTIQDIYLCSKPKHCSPDYVRNIEKGINDIKKGEKDNKYKTIKILDIIFLEELKVFLIMYLKDDIYFKLKDGNSLRLKGFKTFKCKLNDLDPLKKNKIKKKLLDLFEKN